MSVNLDNLRQQAKKEWKALKNSQRPLILVGTATCGQIGRAHV